MRMILFAIALAFLPFSIEAAEQLDIYSTDFWELTDSTNQITWIQIHNSKEAKTSGIAHISVHTRNQGRPIWEVDWICPHLAITTEALKRSVAHPYKTRGAYPEHFYAAYNRWKEDAKNGKSIICTTSAQDFLKQNHTKK